jgi:two-component system osmolarity sensor histidine kinase EnvZ
LKPVKAFSIGLFWRIFFLLAGLLAACTAAWVQIAIEIEAGPRAQQTAQQVSTQINLSRAALIHADPIYRMALIKSMAKQEGVRIWPKEMEDVIATAERDTVDVRLRWSLMQLLGPDATVTSSVNGEPGLWVSFAIDGDDYWLLADPSRLPPVTSGAWLLWLSVAFFLAVAGAALIASRLSAPLHSLARAMQAIRRGDFANLRLDENLRTTEIREVNRGFNAMAAQLSQLEQDRVVMMAGLSHDLRTPLTRLRLEAEMSVPDSEARLGMVSDIDQMDQMIHKFLEYARPGGQTLVAVDLAAVVAARVARATGVGPHESQLLVHNGLTDALWIMADPTDLGRVISNLLENARRYGATPGSEPAVAEIEITVGPTPPTRKGEAGQVTLYLRDHGPGVSDADLLRLTTPFFRADTSRSQATGSGLGLSIVEKAMAQMGAHMHLTHAPGGGLQVELVFQAESAVGTGL